jgi:hypothetical protein
MLGSRFYVFPGGCVTYRFDFQGTEPAAAIEEATLAIGFTDRETLRETRRRASHGRLELDP